MLINKLIFLTLNIIVLPKCLSGHQNWKHLVQISSVLLCPNFLCFAMRLFHGGGVGVGGGMKYIYNFTIFVSA